MPHTVFSLKTPAILLGILLNITTICVYAATQGTAGTLSVGEFDIEVSVEKLVQISMNNSILIDPHQNNQHITDVCVYSNANNTVARQYFITLDSDNGNGTFLLKNHTNNVTVSYDATWSDGNHNLLLSDNIEANTALNGSDTLDCSSTVPATLTLTIPTIENTQEGTYTDTLTVYVRPD